MHLHGFNVGHVYVPVDWVQKVVFMNHNVMHENAAVELVKSVVGCPSITAYPGTRKQPLSDDGLQGGLIPIVAPGPSY